MRYDAEYVQKLEAEIEKLREAARRGLLYVDLFLQQQKTWNGNAFDDVRFIREVLECDSTPSGGATMTTRKTFQGATWPIRTDGKGRIENVTWAIWMAMKCDFNGYPDLAEGYYSEAIEAMLFGGFLG